MRVAITGGTGFLGGHLARDLQDRGHTVVLVSRGQTAVPEWVRSAPEVSFERANVTDRRALQAAFEGCDAVAHFAGINFEHGAQTYGAVHRRGTATVVEAAADRGIERLVLSSYLRARPGTRSGYLTSKWAAEEVVRSAPMAATVLKPAGIFGRGDQLLTNLARWLRTVPIAPRIGLADPELRPVAVEDVVRLARRALAGDEMQGETVSLLGPETVRLSTLVDRIGRAIGRNTAVVPAPVTALRIGAWIFERTVRPPVITRAALRMLAEGMTAPAPADVCVPPPDGLAPERSPSTPTIDAAVGDVPRYGLSDLAL